jgi:WD40 repeat protein
MRPFIHHAGPVTGTAAVPGTRQVVTAAYDGAVGLFDFASRRAELLGYHEHLVNGVVVDAKRGHRAASCSSDYTIKLWDLATKSCVQTLRGHADDVEAFVFAGETVGASASRDGRILVWNLRTGAIDHVFDQHEKDVLSLACHDGRLYSSGDDKTLRVWDIRTGSLLRTLGPFELETDTCAIDAVHGRILLGCDDGVVRVFAIDSGAPVAQLPAHASGIKKVAVSPTGDFLSAAYDQRILVWDGRTLERRLELQNVKHKWERSFSFSADGRSVLAGTFDGTVLEWDSASGQSLGEMPGESVGNACFNRVAASPSGATVVVADDGWIRRAFITAESARWADRYAPTGGRMLMNAVAIDEEAGVVAAGAHDQKLHLYGIGEGALLPRADVHLGEGPINYISIATQPGAVGDCFVACYSGRVVRVSSEGAIVARLPIHEGAVKSVRLHPQRALGVSCSADGQMRSWDFAGESHAQYLGHCAIINDVDLAPSGERLASVSRDFTLKVFEFDSGRLLASIALGRRSLKSVCFATEDVVLVGDYWGGLIRVDLASGRSQRRRVARNGISSVARCGPHVIATSYDGSVLAVDPLRFEVVHQIEAMTQRAA